MRSLALICAFFCLFSPPLSAGAESGILQKLESSAGGQYEALMTPRAIRFKSNAFNYTLVSKAPDWRVTIFRNDTHEICRCKLEEFKHKLKGSVGSGVTLDFTKKPVVSQASFRKYGTTGFSFTYPGNQAKASDIFVTERPAPVDKVVVRTINLGLPQQIDDILSTVVCMPMLPGTIYDTMGYEKPGSGFWAVRTNSICRKEVSETDFSIPANYKDAGKFEGPFLFKSVSGMMDEVFEGLRPTRFDGRGGKKN